MKTKFCLLIICLLASGACKDSSTLQEQSASAVLGKIIYNNDSDDLKFPAFRHDELWDPEGKPVPMSQFVPFKSINDYLDIRLSGLKNTPVSTLSYCGNFGVPVWDLPDKATSPENIKVLGKDPFLSITEFAHSANMKILFSMRMNDMHHAIFSWPHLWDDFRVKNHHLMMEVSEKEWVDSILPNLKRAANDTLLTTSDRIPKIPLDDFWRFTYNYALEEVRDYFLNTLREACDRYPIDGVEFDWMRAPLFFLPGKEKENIPIMTEFVRQAREIMNKASGKHKHQLVLAMRVPDSPTLALNTGLDIETWLQEGLADAIIAGQGTTFSANPVAEWVALGKKYNVPVYGCIMRHMVRPCTAERLRAAAATLWQEGIDGLYVFNYYRKSEYYLLRELGDPVKLQKTNKTYFVDTDSQIDKMYKPGQVLHTDLPAEVDQGEMKEFTLKIADDPVESSSETLTIKWNHAIYPENLVVLLNGRALTHTATGNSSEEIAYDATSLQKGSNTIQVHLLRNPIVAEAYTLEQIEVRIGYE